MNNDYINNYYNPYYRMYTNPVRDYGPDPFVVNIEDVTKANDTFRTALWTGNHL